MMNIDKKVHRKKGMYDSNSSQKNMIINQRNMLKLACRLAKVGSWYLDTTTMEGQWSKETMHILGLEPGTVPTIPQIMQLLQGASRNLFEEALKSVVEHGQPYTLELEIVTPNGSHKWIRSVGHPIIENGCMVGIEGVIQDITELRIAIDQVEKQDSIFESFFAAIPDLYFVLDFDGTIRDYRAHKSTYLYAPPEQFLNKRIEEVLPQEVILLFINSMKSILEKNEMAIFEYDLKLPIGNQHFECRLSQLPDREQCIAVVRDITDQYLARQELAASEARYRSLLEKAPYPIIISRIRDGQLIYANDWAVHQFGFVGGYGINLHASHIYKNPADRERFLQYLWKKGSIHDQEIQLMNLEGKPFWALISASITEVDQEPALLVAINDITARKEVEDALKLSEEKYRQLTEFTSDVIWVLNVTDKRFTYISPSIQLLSGYTAEEAMFLTIEEFLTPESTRIFIDTLSRGLETFINNPTSTDSHMVEVQQRCKNGEIIWVEFSIKYRCNAQNEIEVIGVSRNIDKRKKMEQEVLYLSYHDQLTGLYNRRFYEKELRRLDTEENHPISLVMADVNGLKLTNDAFGHLVGDKILTTFAEVLKQVCREDDVIARTGGDEFVILLPKTDSLLAEQMVKRIRENLSNKVIHKMHLSVSFGWKTKNDRNESFDIIYKQAEDDMYRHKLFEGRSFKGKTIKLIINTLYEKYPEEKVHSEQVSKLCKQIGQSLGLSQDDINELGMAGLLHDIGKIGIDEVWNKSRKLDEAEWEVVKRHPEIGYQILRSVTEFADIAEAVLAHHERLDGKGYPRGIKGSVIPFMSKILAIVDAYDTMTRKQIYRESLSVKEAILELKKGASFQFDADIARIFVEKVLGEKWD